MSSAFLLALVLGLAPAGLPLGAETQAGPVGVGLEDELQVDSPLGHAETGADGLTVDAVALPPATVGLCPGCPPVSFGEGTAQADAQRIDGPAQRGGPAALVPSSPAAQVAAGVSLAALLAAAGVWVVRTLGLAPLLPFFSRIEDGRLADHPARRQALDFIASNPGATVQDVRQALGLAWGTTVHHLRRLEAAGLVAVRRDGGRKGHWPLGQAPPRDGLGASDRALALLVREHPGLAQNQLAQAAGLGAPTACKRLARLEEAGLVAVVRSGRSRLYVPTARLLAIEPAAFPLVAKVVTMPSPTAVASPQPALAAPLAVAG